MPQRAEQQRQRQRQPEPADRAGGEIEIDVGERGEEQDDADRERAPADAAATSCRLGLLDQQALGVLQIRHGIDVVPVGVADVDAPHQAQAGELADAAAERRVPGRARPIDRREQRRRADEHAGVERVVLREVLADRDDPRRPTCAPWSPRPRSPASPAASRPRAATRPRAAAIRSSRASTARLEQVVAHQQRESPIGEPGARGEDRDAVLEMPVGIVGEVHVQAERSRASMMARRLSAW